MKDLIRTLTLAARPRSFLSSHPAEAMSVAAREKDRFVLIEACLPKGDCSDGLRRLGESFRRSQEKK